MAEESYPVHGGQEMRGAMPKNKEEVTLYSTQCHTSMTHVNVCFTNLWATPKPIMLTQLSLNVSFLKEFKKDAYLFKNI